MTSKFNTSKLSLKTFLMFALIVGSLLGFQPHLFADDALTQLTHLDSLPAQSGGRIKPLSSLAKEFMLFISGKESLGHKAPVDTLLDWIINSDDYQDDALILVPSAWRVELGLSEKDKRISANQLATQAAFLTLAQRAQIQSDLSKSISPKEKKALQIFQRWNLFRSIPDGPSVPLFPPSSLGVEGTRWSGPDQLKKLPADHPLRQTWSALLEAHKNQDLKARDLAVAKINALTEFTPNLSFKAEVFYNRLHPFRWAWLLYLASFLLMMLPFVFLKRIGMASLLAGFSVHTFGFVLRCIVAGRPPVTNMYESVIWVSWAAILFCLILYCIYRSPALPRAAAFMAVLGLVTTDAFPAILDPSIGTLEPVLRSNYWLTIHVLTITMSYGSFALGVGLAHALLFRFAFRFDDKESLRKLSQLVYRSIQIGVVLLAAGTILGGVWAQDSWGRFWGWDPKETWALIALLGYLAILHGRFAGWLKNFGLGFASIVAFLGILMTWYGVNFVLGRGLHSYGFGTGGLGYVVAFTACDLALITFFLICYKRNQAKK